MAWTSRRVVTSLASCTLVQSRGHSCGPRGRHLACLMVQWLAMLQLLWMQLLLLGVHQGSAQDLTHTQEPALEWRGECPQRRGGDRLAPGIHSGRETARGLSKTNRNKAEFVSWLLVYCTGEDGTEVATVPSAHPRGLQIRAR